MKVLTKYRFEVTGQLIRPYQKRSRVSRTGKWRWVDAPRGDGHYAISLFKGKVKEPVNTLKINPLKWEKSLRTMQVGKCARIANVNGKDGEASAYYYLYEGYIYQSEIKLDVDDIALLLEQERANHEDRLRKHVDRVKSRAEAEGGSRAPIREDVQVLVWNRDDGKCVSCGGNEALEFDHIIPVSKGGGNSARNIQLLCETCNRKKGAKIGG